MESNEFEGAFKKKAPPRAARRRRQTDDEEPQESEEPAPAGAKKSGWGDAVDESGEESGVAAPVVPRRRRGLDGDSDSANKHNDTTTSNKHEIPEIDGDDDNVAALIPDLEDEQEDMARQVAEAPSLTKSRVQSIKELDDAIDMALPSTNEIGVDLSVLQSFLYPQEQVMQVGEDVTWDFQFELQALASEMQREKEAHNGEQPVVKPVTKPKERVRKPLAE